MSNNLYSIEGSTVLKGGYPAMCPKQPPVPVTIQKTIDDGKAPEIKLLMQPCTTQCIMCNIHTEVSETENNGRSYVQITCGSQTVGSYIDTPEEKKSIGLLRVEK